MVVLLSMKEALIASGMLSRHYLWRLSKEGKFPAPLRLPGDRKCQYFRQDEVIAWAVAREAWKAERAKRGLSRMGTGPDARAPDADAEAREAGNKDFEDAEARNAAAVKVSEAKAEERIRKGLEADTGADK